MNKKIYFFLRAYNDIDHLTPVILKFSRRFPDLELEVFMYDLDENHSNDYRVKYLADCKINMISISSILFNYSGLWNRYLRIKKYVNEHQKNNLIRLLFKSFDIVFRKFVSRHIAKLNINTKFDNHLKPTDDKKVIFVFDQSHMNFYKTVCDYAKSRSITTIALPHGHNTFDNELIWDHSMRISDEELSDYPFFYDYVVFENSIISDRYLKQGKITETQGVVLGSSRFCEEWIDELEPILPKIQLPEFDKSVLKIVFMLSKPKYNGHPEEVERTIVFLSRYPDVFIILKPHTRGMKFKTKFSKNVMVVDNDFHSSLLINWSDVVLFTMTSVIFHCLKKYKPAIYLKNTHSNRLLSERFFHSWEVHCRDDLRDMIWKLKKEEGYNTYSREDSDNYCKNVIEPCGSDVLTYYTDFLYKLLN